MSAAGISGDGPNRTAGLNDFKAILDYQADALAWPEYLAELKDYLSLPSTEDAERVHHAILMESMPHVVTLIRQLKGMGFKTACLSNTNAEHWKALSDPFRYPYCAELDLLAASHLFRVEKPDHAIYRAFEKLSGAAPEEITFFDDGLKNVEAARAVGWRAECIDPFGETVDQMVKHLGIALPTSV